VVQVGAVLQVAKEMATAAVDTGYTACRVRPFEEAVWPEKGIRTWATWETRASEILENPGAFAPT
jgi:hypothetical protein